MPTTGEQCSHQWVPFQRVTQRVWIIKCEKCGATTVSADGSD